MTDVYTELLQENSELKTKIFRLEQENKALKDNNNHLQAIIDDGRAENKELSFAIEKCLENAGIECDDEEQALRSLPMLGNAHYKVLVEKEGLEQENKELKECYDGAKILNDAYIELTGKYKQALEEILESAKFAQCLPCGSGNLEDCLNCNDDTTNNGQFCMEKRIHDIKTKCVEVLK